MNNHDIAVFKKHGVEMGDSKILERVSSSFTENSLDIQELTKHVNDPLFVSALIYKLVEEREKTNRLLADISEKYDKIMLEMKQPLHAAASAKEADKEFKILGEQDSSILKYIEEQGQATAKDIKTIMNYRGLNAASQRLNKLFKEGHLKKVQVGKKVLYLIKN